MSATVLQKTGSSEKKIEIDFSQAATRRKSFLPDALIKSESVFFIQDVTHKGMTFLEGTEDDVVFPIMGGDNIEERPLKKFCTGSKYLGQWNKLGITGKGLYRYPHGVIYDGYFNKNGEFHGTGTLIYPSGQRIEGIWRNGKLAPDTNFVTKTGVLMNKNYCTMPDRRFQIEVETDLNPPGQEYLTSEQPPPRSIPEKCYDLIEGYYKPKNKTVYAFGKSAQASESASPVMSGGRRSLGHSLREDEMELLSPHYTNIREISTLTYNDAELQETLASSAFKKDQENILWIPTPSQENWIVTNCRKEWDEDTGYRPDLYEIWTKGSHEDEEKVDDHFQRDRQVMLDSLKMLQRKSKTTNSKILKFRQFRKDDTEFATFVALRRIVMQTRFRESDLKYKPEIELSVQLPSKENQD